MPRFLLLTLVVASSRTIIGGKHPDFESLREDKYQTLTLTFLSMIASDPTRNLRDPSSVVQDPVTKRWHFWVDYMKGGEQPGWHASLHHYSAAQIEGPWTNHGLAVNHSSDPSAWDTNVLGTGNECRRS